MGGKQRRGGTCAFTAPSTQGTKSWAEAGVRRQGCGALCPLFSMHRETAPELSSQIQWPWLAAPGDVSLWFWQRLPLGKWNLGSSFQLRKAALRWGALQGPTSGLTRFSFAICWFYISFFPTEGPSPPPPPSLPGSPCLTQAGCPCVLGKGVPASHTADPSRLWTLKNPIFFLIATARALSPLTAEFLPRSPYSCLPLPTPRRTLPPLAVTRVGTHHISCPQSGGARGADSPRPGLPDEIVLFCGG